MYCFYYDETEHSRKINLKTLMSDNFYDNFIAVVVGWHEEKEVLIKKRYLEFESKYEYRKKDGELKSLTMRGKDFRLGFASLNKNTIGFYEDLIGFFDKDIKIYISVFSKIEYLINQILINDQSTILHDSDYMKYSIIKAINVYRPQKVIDAIYISPEIFVKELKIFLKDQIVRNNQSADLKKAENIAFEEILLFLDSANPPDKIDWMYDYAFVGLKKLYDEMGVGEYKLTIDKEGDDKKTLNAAKNNGIQNVEESKSDEVVGIRMADMIAGLVSRLMQSLHSSLTNNYPEGVIHKTLLESGWFALNQRQIDLYRKFYDYICIQNDYWYKTYSGIYSDDLVAFVALLQYMSQYENVEMLNKTSIKEHQENYNSCACYGLNRHYELMKNKIPIDFWGDESREYIFNKQKAKVYKYPLKHPMIHLVEGDNIYNVLSVGLFRDGTPMVTVLENNKPVCYRLPIEYQNWATAVVGNANMGIALFPSDVNFSITDGEYFAEIL